MIKQTVVKRPPPHKTPYWLGKILRSIDGLWFESVKALTDYICGIELYPNYFYTTMDDFLSIEVAETTHGQALILIIEKPTNTALATLFTEPRSS